jgi:hypothetical protein
MSWLKLPRFAEFSMRNTEANEAILTTESTGDTEEEKQLSILIIL